MKFWLQKFNRSIFLVYCYLILNFSFLIRIFCRRICRILDIIFSNPYIAPNGRIINVTSGKYTKARKLPTFESVTCSQELDPLATPYSNYAQSKLANCLFTVALNNYMIQNKEEFDDVKIFCARPGFVRGTQLGRYHNYYLRMLAMPLIYLFSRDLDYVS